MDNFNNSAFPSNTTNNVDNTLSNAPQPTQNNVYNNQRMDTTNASQSDSFATAVQTNEISNMDPSSFQTVSQPATSFASVDQNLAVPQQPTPTMPEVQKTSYSYDTPQQLASPLNNVTQQSELVEQHQGPSKFEQFKDGLPSPAIAIALIFFMIIQNLGSRCKNLCKVDASMQNAIFSGGALGYLLVCCMPYFITNTNSSILHMSDLYLKSAPHSLLAAFFAFGIGLVMNHAFERSASHTIMQDVKPSNLMYGLNTFVLCCVAFVFAVFLTKILKESTFSYAQYVFFFSGLFYIENAIMGNLYIDSHLLTRRILLCCSAVWGLLMLNFLSPLFLLLGYSFFIGFMLYSILKIEITSAKRNVNYIGFVISFFAIAAANLIYSLHNSIHC